MHVGREELLSIQLAKRLPDWSAGDLLQWCSAARFSVCRLVLQSPRARHAQLVTDILERILIAS